MAGGKSKDWWLRNQFLGNRKLCGWERLGKVCVGAHEFLWKNPVT